MNSAHTTKSIPRNVVFAEIHQLEMFWDDNVLYRKVDVNIAERLHDAAKKPVEVNRQVVRL